MKIYTKAGDKGKTFFPAIGKVEKDNEHIEAIGELDELTAWLGRIIDHSIVFKISNAKCYLLTIQKNLLNIGYEICIKDSSSVINTEHVKELEDQIDLIESKLPELKNFILPVGGSDYHYARALSRRVERRVYRVVKCNPERFQYVLQYLNRLSDFLFSMARYKALKGQSKETIWELEK